MLKKLESIFFLNFSNVLIIVIKILIRIVVKKTHLCKTIAFLLRSKSKML